jgi:hypothetical protein
MQHPTSPRDNPQDQSVIFLEALNTILEFAEHKKQKRGLYYQRLFLSRHDGGR